ncbi:hypothetical protein TNIN_100291 [Trichonephila inaurata madagascariensis]|uniref:Uncharacterized protein n=1 Tax=Trichonephila inaurata madagascariensis TaxID=2747483 RepID=A0A8X6YD18_9ARAC|nr:hypothetical protein TNIN_100291 [Trichonephila inaurata madagascariensis]
MRMDEAKSQHRFISKPISVTLEEPRELPCVVPAIEVHLVTKNACMAIRTRGQCCDASRCFLPISRDTS